MNEVLSSYQFFISISVVLAKSDASGVLYRIPKKQSEKSELESRAIAAEMSSLTSHSTKGRVDSKETFPLMRRENGNDSDDNHAKGTKQGELGYTFNNIGLTAHWMLF